MRILKEGNLKLRDAMGSPVPPDFHPVPVSEPVGSNHNKVEKEAENIRNQERT